jgi:hypothetical protein
MVTATPVEVLLIGERTVITVTFTVGGVAPSVRPTATWRVWAPGQTTPVQYVSGVDPEATPITGDLGAFQLSVLNTIPGTWWFKCDATGSAEGAEQDRWYVQAEPPF